MTKQMLVRLGARFDSDDRRAILNGQKWQRYDKFYHKVEEWTIA